MPACPICRQPIDETRPSRPFCSERCRLLDLGNWLDERYAVPASEEGQGGGPTTEPPPTPVPPPARRRRFDS